MPQMAPISWLLMFFFFTIMLLLFNSMNYFLFKPNPLNYYNKNFKNKNLIWKW
uniref:ATP synthase complex subunit 8 n=1 Tax=Protochauliodes humeralis TaxID=2900188 RepID=A0A8K1WBC7_9NEOP|nr:ATP synthase F0 subunit 8 [Protochauliodes humeralis]